MTCRVDYNNHCEPPVIDRQAGAQWCHAQHMSVGDAYDNAMAESFFSTLEAELLSRRRFASQAEAKMACFSYIGGWYKPVPVHSGLGYRSPTTYEADMQAAMTKT